MSSKKPIIKSRNPVIIFNKLQMVFGEPYVIDLKDCEGSITVTIPNVLSIISMGYDNFYANLNLLTSNTTTYRLMLWKNGTDWNVLSDFELFISLYKGLSDEVSELLFNGLKLSEFEPYVKKKEDKEIIVLYHKEKQIEINEQVYFHISQYLRKAFNINPEEKITKDRNLKLMYIKKDEMHLEAESKKSDEEKEKSSPEEQLLALFSSCVNHPGFKYNWQQLKDINMCQFFDAVNRLQIYESSTALMKGMYSGFVDVKGIASDAYNFMKII